MHPSILPSFLPSFHPSIHHHHHHHPFTCSFSFSTFSAFFLLPLFHPIAVLLTPACPPLLTLLVCSASAPHSFPTLFFSPFLPFHSCPLGSPRTGIARLHQSQQSRFVRMQVSSPVPHITQEDDWDCGLACVAMIANALGAHLSLAEVTLHCSVESVWTIDLAYLLRKLSNDQVNLPKLCFSKRTHQLIPNLSPGREEGWDFSYYTSTLGVDAAHSREKFYRKSFDDDQKRVNALFKGADAANIRVIELALPLDDFKRFLYCGKYGIVTLVNQRLLRCRQCLEKSAFCSCSAGTLGSVVQWMRGFRYIGHFIVLVAYDPNSDLFYYRDPAVGDDLCSISGPELDDARNSSGTDHDCIVVKVT